MIFQDLVLIDETPKTFGELIPDSETATVEVLEVVEISADR